MSGGGNLIEMHTFINAKGPDLPKIAEAQKELRLSLTTYQLLQFLPFLSRNQQFYFSEMIAFYLKTIAILELAKTDPDKAYNELAQQRSRANLH